VLTRKLSQFSATLQHKVVRGGNQQQSQTDPCFRENGIWSYNETRTWANCRGLMQNPPKVLSTKEREKLVSKLLYYIRRCIPVKQTKNMPEIHELLELSNVINQSSGYLSLQ
jgi:hypothetical protein